MPRLVNPPFQPQPDPNAKQVDTKAKAVPPSIDWQHAEMPPFLRAQPPVVKDATFVAPSAGKAFSSLLFVDKLPDMGAGAKGQDVKQQLQKAEIEALSKLKPKELHALGRKDAKAFFKALLPAALESERKYGVPAVVTLVQAAVESDFARSPIGGYNIFGIKGEGPAGTVKLRTREVVKGRNHYVKEPFAKYHNFYEAVKEHGKLYNNGYYDKGLQQFGKDRDPLKFIDNVAKIYATDPHYARTLKTRIEEYGLLELVASHR